MDRRSFFLGGALAVTGALAGAARLRPPAVPPISPQAVLPDTVGTWRAFIPEDVVLPQEDQLTGRLYDALVIKSYARHNRPAVTAVLAYGAKQDYAFQMHRPEVCYPASGFWLRSFEERQLNLAERRLPGNVMQAKRGSRLESVLFWTRIGDAFPQTLMEQRLAVLGDAGSWRASDGVLMRLSMQGEELADDAAELESFAATLIGEISPAARQLLLGPLS